MLLALATSAVFFAALAGFCAGRLAERHWIAAKCRAMREAAGGQDKLTQLLEGDSDAA